MKYIKSFLPVLVVYFLAEATGIAENPKDFAVKSPTHQTTFTLSEHGGKIVVLHFLLKTECPYCLKYTHQYAKESTVSPEVVHLFLKPDSEEEIKAWAEKLKHDDLEQRPAIYQDVDARLAKQFRIPDGYQFHGQSVHYPALVVLDGRGEELFRYVGKSNSDRMKVDEFRSKLKSAI